MVYAFLIPKTKAKMKNKRNPSARLLTVVMLLSLCYLFTACSDSDEKDNDSQGEQSSGSYTFCPNFNHPHIIDLGLPSGTKWACCNIGASAPEEWGDYYAWGETATKNSYDWDTYLYGSDEDNVVNIGSDIAGTQYDAATANWGAPWRMPTYAQMWELIINTTSIWTTRNGVKGYKFTGSNGGAIFLPAAYELWGWASDRHSESNWGCYWTSMLYGNLLNKACILYFDSDDVGEDDWVRSYGIVVRPVR